MCILRSLWCNRRSAARPNSLQCNLIWEAYCHLGELLRLKDNKIAEELYFSILKKVFKVVIKSIVSYFLFKWDGIWLILAQFDDIKSNARFGPDKTKIDKTRMEQNCKNLSTIVSCWALFRCFRPAFYRRNRVALLASAQISLKIQLWIKTIQTSKFFWISKLLCKEVSYSYFGSLFHKNDTEDKFWGDWGLAI